MSVGAFSRVLAPVDYIGAGGRVSASVEGYRLTAADESAVTARVREAVTLWASPGSAGSAGGRSLTTVAGLTYEENDGSIKHCLLLANDGHAFGDYYFYDAVALDFGDAADVMRNALKPGAKTVEVEFPQGERRRYVNLAAARKAVENYVAQRYASRIPPTPW